jgi:hypothetical protein
VCAVGEVLVYEGTWVGVACCWNRSEAGLVLAQHIVGVSLGGSHNMLQRVTPSRFRFAKMF